MSKNKRKEYDYYYWYTQWKDFFTGKGFEAYSDEARGNSYVTCFIGRVDGSEDMYIHVYAGDYRTDTSTGGCIGVDFVSDYNKLSQMPVYMDLSVSQENAWNNICRLASRGSLKVESSNK